MKAAWVTDIHLNFLDRNKREAFYKAINDEAIDAVFLSGDIGEARAYQYCPDTRGLMAEMAAFVKAPIYFVLGNHDYYFGNVEQMRMSMWDLCKEEDNLFYLTGSHGYQLNKSTLVFGVDGWADGRAGNYENSSMVLNDSHLIADLNAGRVGGKYTLLEQMQKLSDNDTESLEDEFDFYFNETMKAKPEKIIIVTHVPPFEKACLHRYKVSDDYALPFYCNKGLGEMILKTANEWPDIDFTVLCGHTHSEAVAEISDNLIVLAGKSEYYSPSISKIIEY